MKLEDSRPQMVKSDETDRRRAVQETDRSFVVEASAGTGKTRTLLDRILYLVLEKGRDGSPVPLSRICAITFTEKAAGEMKVRLRQHLEQMLLDAKAPDDRLERAQNALNDLETASISTFHSFAVSLLKERPIEAGLDPRFTALDDMRSELFFREVWQPWIDRALTERNPVLEKALRNGFRLGDLEDLARTLRLHWLSIRGLQCDSPPSEEEYRETLHGLLGCGKQLLRLLLDPKDKLAGILEDALNWLEHPADDGMELSKPGGAGAAAHWTGAKETVRTVRDFVLQVVETQELYRRIPAQRLLHEIVSWIKTDFMACEWEKRKRDAGLLDFDDQLRLARDLLLQNKAVRREFQMQHQALLVDEFQDTDPIQWETVLLLSSEDLEETDFSRLRPGPGRLFIVGDPKQSIYRFRNADIETYLGIVDSRRLDTLGLSRLELTTNFRSVPSILRFVDAVFENTMNPTGEGSRYQPRYLAFGEHGDRKPEVHPPSVSLLADAKSENDEKRKTKELVRIESGRIARLILEMNGSESWKVHDAAQKGGEGWRAPRYGDIAVLLPVLTHAHVLEDKFRDFGIPYVLEGGKFYYARSEVSSAITILRAVANPNDAVALYGSLRSIFFGLSDEDLLRAHIDGLPLDYRKDVPQSSPLHHPFEILRDLHLHRHERRASETYEILLQQTGAREALAVRGFQSLANLNKLGRTLRALQGDTAYSQIVDLMGTMDEEGLDESESRLMEERSNAVRIMTVHKAKGLDFPIVLVAAAGLKKSARRKDVFVDRSDKKIFALSAGSKDSGLQTPSLKALSEEEKKRENAELVRLLYVALTRARDHMVVSTHTAKWKQLENSEKCVPDTSGTRLEPLGPFLEDCFSGKNELARIIKGTGLDARGEPPPKKQFSGATDWESIAVREYKELRDLLSNTPSSGKLKAAGHAFGASETEDLPQDNRMPEVAAKRSVRIGVAFHEVMERVDIVAPNNSGELVRDVAAKHGLDPAGMRMLGSMMQASLSSELLQQARSAILSGRKLFRELPFIRSLESAVIEEGKIDLLFEGEDGWVLVDYKTDWVSDKSEEVEAFFRNKYAEQIREYAAALSAQSVQVQEAYLLLGRTGTTVRID